MTRVENTNVPNPTETYRGCFRPRLVSRCRVRPCFTTTIFVWVLFKREKKCVTFYSTMCLGYQTTKRRKEGKEYKARRRRQSVGRSGLIKRFASSRYTCACRSSLFMYSSLPFLSLLSIQRVRQRGLFDVPFRFVRFVEPVFRHLEFPREHVQLHR